MGRPYALPPEVEGAIFGVLTLFTPKTREYRQKRRELADLHGVRERTIDNIVARRFAHIQANGKAPALASKGPQTTLEEVTPRAQMLSESTSSAKPSDRGEPDGGK